MVGRRIARPDRRATCVQRTRRQVGIGIVNTDLQTAPNVESSPGLVRAMTRWDLTALALNGIIGSGIFGLPAIVAKQLGFASPLAFAICAAIVYVFVLCFAEVASHFTESGGPYLYGRAILGPFVGFEVGWSVW